MMLSAIYLLCFFYVEGAAGIDREHWIAISERTWDYAPTGNNVISGNSIDVDEYASTYLRQDSNRIGKIYNKVLYIEYKDGTYKQEIKKQEWQGIIGPIMWAEIGDTFIIHLLNNASRPYSIHPHGVQYLKKSEGAYYPDNTLGNDKNDDHVQPKTIYTYRWDVVEDQGPTAWDNDCIIRIYHSHYDSIRDIYSGLVGTLILCKAGTMEKWKNKPWYVLLVTVFDENMSWYLDDNINSYCTDLPSVDKEDEDFMESNRKHSINGYMFGNLPGLSVCDNTDVMWFMFCVGNEIDAHSLYFHGHVLTYQHRRVDTLSLFPASMAQASMLTQNPGKWLITSQVNEHLKAGIQAIYEVRNCSKVSPSQQNSPVRRYFIAAVEIFWDYGPTSINQLTGQKLDYPGSDSATYFEQSDNRIGGVYKKDVFREFTDATFTMEKLRTAKELHLGVLGPIMHAQGGDTIEIVFKNKASHPYNIEVHGVSYGSINQNGPFSPSPVAPGYTATYTWKVPDSFAPTDNDVNCISWLYYSSVDLEKDTNTGLVGPLIVCKKLAAIGLTGADYDFVMMPTVFDENKSWYLQDNIDQFTGNPESVDVNDPDFMESNTMHSINGYMYGNQPGLDLCAGSTARWHFLGLGTSIDIHGIHFTGNTIQLNKNTRDVVSITPHVSYTAVMTPDNEGIFNVECMTADHFKSGMRQHYRVNACGKESSMGSHHPPGPITATYYIAAEEIEWDYSPSRTWEYTMYPDSNNRPGNVFLNRGQQTIGSKYIKVVYLAYTDPTFKTRKMRTAEEEHLGIQGPTIYCKVGDRVKVVFMNKATRKYSIYAHGLKSESTKAKPAEPGSREVYIWDVPERSGPNNDETDCLTWAYYSDVNQVMDIYSGLIGAVVVCKNTFNPIATPVLRFVLLFMVFDENYSWYLDRNIQKYCLNASEVDKNSDEFIESNKMHSINGRMYANAIGLTMTVGDHVVWHIMGLGNEVDIHTVHWHGHSIKDTRGQELHTDVAEFIPGSFETVSMIAIVPGTWFLHCHVDDHVLAGMVTIYTVLEKIPIYQINVGR